MCGNPNINLPNYPCKAHSFRKKLEWLSFENYLISSKWSMTSFRTEQGICLRNTHISSFTICCNTFLFSMGPDVFRKRFIDQSQVYFYGDVLWFTHSCVIDTDWRYCFCLFWRMWEKVILTWIIGTDTQDLVFKNIKQ